MSNLSNPFSGQRVDGWERKQVGRGVGGDEAGDEFLSIVKLDIRNLYSHR